MTETWSQKIRVGTVPVCVALCGTRRRARIPSLSMRHCNVVRFMPSSAAAPLGPPTTQPVASSTRR